MAITDDKLYFSKVQTITVSAVSDYYLDVKKIKEVGKGSQLYINIDVCTAFTLKSSGTLNIYLNTTTKEPTSAHRVSAISINDLEAYVVGARKLVTVGKKVKVPLPSVGLKSHINLTYQIGSALVAGAVNAYLTLG